MVLYKSVYYYYYYFLYTTEVCNRVLPSEWKLAEVTAIHKRGSKSDRNNYRPISVTSVCCKINETFIRNHMSYLLQNNLVSNTQYGFIRGRSMMLQLLHMKDDWTGCMER